MSDDNLTLVVLQTGINELKIKIEDQEEEIKKLRKELRRHENDVDCAHRI